MQIKSKDLIEGANARIINQSTGHDISAKPTGQGYGAARKGPAVRGPIEAVSDVEYPQGEFGTKNVKNLKG